MPPPRKPKLHKAPHRPNPKKSPKPKASGMREYLKWYWANARKELSLAWKAYYAAKRAAKKAKPPKQKKPKRPKQPRPVKPRGPGKDPRRLSYLKRHWPKHLKHTKKPKRMKVHKPARMVTGFKVQRCSPRPHVMLHGHQQQGKLAAIRYSTPMKLALYQAQYPVHLVLHKFRRGIELLCGFTRNEDEFDPIEVVTGVPEDVSVLLAPEFLTAAAFYALIVIPWWNKWFSIVSTLMKFPTNTFHVGCISSESGGAGPGAIQPGGWNIVGYTTNAFHTPGSGLIPGDPGFHIPAGDYQLQAMAVIVLDPLVSLAGYDMRIMYEPDGQPARPIAELSYPTEFQGDLPPGMLYGEVNAGKGTAWVEVFPHGPIVPYTNTIAGTWVGMAAD